MDEDDGKPLYDIISDKNQQRPDDAYFANALKEEIRDSLSSLTEREAEVLRYYFGLDGYPEMKLEGIGEKFGLTRERIRQIKEKAIRKLKHPRRGLKLRSYWNESETS